MTKSRSERILDGVAVWASFYRANPNRFVADYLHIELRLFQKIVIVLMNLSVVFVFIASRGLGKTYMCAIYCVFRAVMYPGTKICIASGTRGQAINVLEKIMNELKPRSPELALEINDKETQMNGTKAIIQFKNGSFIKVVTSGESARGNRANVLIIDEFRLVHKDVIDTILRKFLASEREPLYSELTKEQKREEKKKERNRTLFFSSAYFQDHWSYRKCTDTCRFMLDENRHDFICGFPWQLAVEEDLLRMEDVEEQMSESDFTEIKWAMEMDAIFWGAGDGSFFDYATVSKNRQIKYAMLPSEFSRKLGNDRRISIPQKAVGEVRILSADIALMSSKKNNNDATAVFVNQMMPSKSGRYMNNIVYCDTMEGVHTEDQALKIRKLYDEFMCDYIVLDCQGVGLGVFDSLARDIVDPETGEIYPALSCCNDSTMADRCSVPGAEKVIWSIKASSVMNSECALLLREGFRSGRIRLLQTEYDADELLSEIGSFNKLRDIEKLQIKMPYIHTTLLIDELVKLQHEETGGKVRVFEKAGMRKDRYSSLAYNYYVATQLEAKLSRRQAHNRGSADLFAIRAPSANGKVVSGKIGRSKESSWRGNG